MNQFNLPWEDFHLLGCYSMKKKSQLFKETVLVKLIVPRLLVKQVLYVMYVKKGLEKAGLINHKKEVHPEKSYDSEIAENVIIAEELEEIVQGVRLIYNKDCHDCNMREEVVQSKEELLVKKDAEIEIIERRVLKTDEKKKTEKKYQEIATQPIWK